MATKYKIRYMQFYALRPACLSNIYPTSYNMELLYHKHYQFLLQISKIFFGIAMYVTWIAFHTTAANSSLDLTKAVYNVIKNKTFWKINPNILYAALICVSIQESKVHVSIIASECHLTLNIRGILATEFWGSTSYSLTRIGWWL